MQVRPPEGRKYYVLEGGLDRFKARVKPGQTLRGRVIDVLPRGRFIVRFRGFNLLAESILALQRGQTIFVQVKRLTPKVVLQYLLPQYPPDSPVRERYPILKVPLRDAQGWEAVAEVTLGREKGRRRSRKGDWVALIRLITPRLGLIEAELALQEQKVEVKFWVEDEVVQGLFLSKLEWLKGILERTGYVIVALNCLVFEGTGWMETKPDLERRRLFDVTA